jgi:Domain of unknown function (DUF4417)
VGSPVAGPWQVPILKPIETASLPTQFVAFDDRKRTIDPRIAAIHFYRDDLKFSSVIERPLDWVSRFSDFGFILTPDISLGDDMPPWMRQKKTCISRAIGVIWQSRGMNVIPSLRWRSNDDLPFVTAGISEGAVIAVSNYGFRRDLSERIIFRSGMEAILNTLKPKAVLLYGSLDANLKALLETKTELIEFRSPIDNQRKMSLIRQMSEAETLF